MYTLFVHAMRIDTKLWLLIGWVGTSGPLIWPEKNWARYRIVAGLAPTRSTKNADAKRSTTPS